MRIPGGKKELVNFAQEYGEICGVSQGQRLAAARAYAQYIESGQNQGGPSLSNMLYAHDDRLASHLFCPTEARFMIDFENKYPEQILQQAEMVARLLTRAFSVRDIDITFGEAVKVALDYGAAIIKTGGTTENITRDGQTLSHLKTVNSRIIPPWMFGVENEGKNGLAEQEITMELVYLSEHDVWRRIAHMPDAEKLFKRITSHGDKNEGPAFPASFVQLFSISPLNITQTGSTQNMPGGIVQTSGSNAYGGIGPTVIAKQYPMREFWARDDDRGDYLMIQMIEPDILISPLYKRTNEFCANCRPYNLVQPNVVPGYFWGRSEIIDLIPLQESLSETMSDLKRLIGVQYDKRYAFLGFDGDGQELYDDMRHNGWVAGRQGTDVKDMTPTLPPGAIEYIKILLEQMESVGGFGNILSGQGEAGVRAGNHANTLVKTASPRLRDRSLVVERQYAALGDNVLHYMEAKDATQYYTNAEKTDETSFLLEQMPDDRRVTVDSHSSSPIYENDHTQLAAFGLKTGLVQGDDAIEMLNFPNKDELKRKFRLRQAQQQQQQQQIIELAKTDPQAAKALAGGGRSHR